MSLLVAVVVLAGACGAGSANRAVVAPVPTAATGATAGPYAQSIHQGYSGSGKPRLQFVGDSITWQASGDLNRHFGPTHDVAITAHIGWDTLWESGDVAQAGKLAPKVAVINLGTNDAVRMIRGAGRERRQPLAAIQARYAMFLTEFPPSTCVIFVTINTHNPTWAPAGAAAINAYLHSHFAHIADWNKVWSPAYFDGSDTPHPNERGRQALIGTIDDAIAGCPSKSR